MEGKKLTVEELKKALACDFEALAQEVVEAMNHARAGRIIADSEEPVRDAHAEFRQRMYQKAVELLQAKQESFSPSAEGTAEQGQAEGHAPDDQRASDGS